MKQNLTADFHNIISTEKLEEMIDFQLELIWGSGENLAQEIPPIMLWGAPGVGKSTIIRNLAEKHGVGFIDVRLAQREPVDIRGLPVPSEDGVKWLISSEWPRDPESRGIILFDELTAADRSLQVAAYEFILDRRLGDLYKVPEGWYIMAAGNRAQDRAVSMTMSSALANRFLHLELEADAESWVKWGMKNDIHPTVSGFIRYRPELLFTHKNENLERGWPSPRSWERLSTMIEHFSEKEHLMNNIIFGLVGQKTGVEFMAYYTISKEFDDIAAIMRDPSMELEIPTKPDRKYAICAAMAYYLWRGKDEADTKLLVDGFYRISLDLSSDFAALAMIDAINGAKNDETLGVLIQSKKYAAWSKKHGKAFKPYAGALAK